MHGGVVSGHGASDRRLQDQAERHPGAIQGGYQADVRLMRLAPTVGAQKLTRAAKKNITLVYGALK